MSINFHVSKKFRWVLLVLFLVTIFCSIFIYGQWRELKSEYQLEYQSLTFRFPSHLVLEKLSISQADNFSLSTDSLAVSWQWRPLIRGQLDIVSLSTNHLNLDLQTSSTDDAEGSTLLSMRLRDIHLQNTRIRLSGQEDTTELSFASFRIPDASISEEIIVDSLLVDDAKLAYHYFPQQSKLETTSDTLSFAMADLPTFSIGHLGINRSGIDYQSKEQSYQIEKLNLGLNGWKSTKLLNFQLDQLAFTYQDTLDFNLHIEQAQVSEPLESRMRDIQLYFPGLALHIGTLGLRKEQLLAGELQLLPSSFSFGALKRWYPDIMQTFNPEIADDSLITLAGNLSFTSDQLYFDSLSIDLMEQTRTNVLGTVDWSDDTLQFDFSFKSLQTSRSDLSTLLLHQDYNDFFNWPSFATGEASLTGTPESFDISSRLSTPEGTLFINSLTNTDKENNLYYTINLKSESLLLNQMVDYLPLEIPKAQLGMTLKGLLAEDETQDYFRMDLSSERLEVEGQQLEGLHFTYLYNHDYDSLWARLNDPLATLDMQGAIISGDTSAVTYQGQVSGLSSQWLSDDLPMQTLKTEYEGAYRWQDDDFFAVELSTRNTQLNNAALVNTVLPDTDLSFREAGTQIYTTIRSAGQAVFSLTSDTSLYSLDFGADNWPELLPDAEAFLSLKLDSATIMRLTGKPLALDLNEIVVKKEDARLTVFLDAPHLQYEDTHLQQLLVELQAQEEQKSGYLSLNSLENPFLPIDSLRVDVSQNEDYYQLDLGGLIAELQEPLSFGLDLHLQDSVYTLRLDEQRPLMLAGDAWQIQQNEGLSFDAGFSLKAGDIRLKKNSTEFSFNTQPDGSMQLSLDSLRLSDILYALDTSRSADGHFLASLNYEPTTGDVNWEAELNDIQFSNTTLGNIRSEGYYQGNSLNSTMNLSGKHTQADVHLYDTGNGLEYTADVSELDISILKSTGLLSENISLQGLLTAKVSGRLDTLSHAKGYLAMRDGEVTFSDVSSSFYLPTDSVYLDQGKLQFDEFILYDVEKRPLAMSGSIMFWPELYADLEIKSDRFRLIDENNRKADVSGVLMMRADLSLTGRTDNLTAFGNLDILPGAYLRYLYRGNISLSDASNIVTFVEFDALDQKNEFLSNSPVQNPINWNVNLNMANTNLEVILNEITQENIKLSAGGEIRLRSGNSYLPMVYGNLTASNGRALIFPPMLPDLDLNISEARLNWEGDPLNPTITFEGIETVKASPRGLSPTLKERYDLVDFQVLLRLDDTKLDNLAPAFDLQSTDGSVNTYLQGLGSEQREKYAIDLLVFGNIASESTASAPRAMEKIVSKMNEIASRNFTKTDVSFGVVQHRTPGEGPVASTRTSVNYKISRQLFHDRMFLSIGGNVGSYSASPVAPSTHLIGNVEVGYRLQQQPEISIIGARKHVYQGVIDGDIVRSSVGLTFRRSYPDWYYVFHPNEDKKGRK